MKKLMLMAAIAVFGFTMNAQEFKVGAHIGLPMGDVKDYSSLNIAVDVSYLWNVSEAFNAGLTAGYNTFLGKDDADALGYLPIAAAGRFNVSDDFTIGADLGYAIGINPSGIDSGFYYAPRVQYGVSESLDIVLAYKGISVNSATASALSLGVELKL